MGIIIVQALYYFLPSYIANATPVICARFKLFEFLNHPVDFDYKIGNQPLFGHTKTFRGIICGAIMSIFTIWIQALLFNFIPGFYLFKYELPQILWLGFLLGMGEGLGDLLKSFFKRRLNIDSTKPFFPFDQLSFLGALFLGSMFHPIHTNHIIVIIVASLFIPVIANLIAYKLGWKKVWW